METLTDFIFLGSKITVNDACNNEVKRCLLLQRKAMTNLDSIFKSRYTTFFVCVEICFFIDKAMVFLVVTYGSGGGHGNRFQYSCLENPHGQRNLVATVHGITKNQT